MTERNSETKLVAISRERHIGKSWQAPPSYDFARPHIVVPLAGQEIAHAARSMPLGFTSSNGQLTLVALLGLLPDINLFVAPNGQWLGPYIPAALRGYPFSIGKTTQEGNFALLIDEASNLVLEDEVGTPFFADDQVSPHPKTQAMLEFLVQVRRGNDAVNTACKALHVSGVVEPWPITLKEGDKSRSVAGILRINEKALTALPDEAFLTLRKAGALPIAYAQLISMQNFSALEKLAQTQNVLRQRQLAEESKLFMPAMEDEKFDWQALFKD